MRTLDAMEKMVGDVNFFLHPDDRDDAQEGGLIGEVDIMIAETECRGTGMGISAVKALLVYVQIQMGFILEEYVMNSKETGDQASLKGFMVKIKEKNSGSRSLFEKLGFRQEGGVDYFGEFKMVMDAADLQKQSWWEPMLGEWEQLPYGSLVDEMKFT